MQVIEKMERETGVEPATSSLASCGRLSIGQLPHTLPDSGGTQPPRTRIAIAASRGVAF